MTMRVLIKKQEQEGNFPSATIKNGVLTIGDISINYAEQFAPNAYVIFLKVQNDDGSTGIRALDGEQVALSREGGLIAKHAWGASGEVASSVFSILWCESTIENSTLFIMEPVEAASFNHEFVNFKGLLLTLGEYHPRALALHEKIKARRKHIFQLSPIESIAMLERQVDILTLLVKELVTLLPEEQVPAWAGGLFDMVDESGYNTIKVTYDMIGEMSQYKAYVREMQRRYFEAINQIQAT
jgi:hypothetical protein